MRAVHESFLALEVLSTPRESSASRPPEVERWLEAQLGVGAADKRNERGDTQLSRHPLFGAVRGFASAHCRITEGAVEMRHLQVSLGPENQVIEAAAQVLHGHQGELVLYGGRSWPLRFLIKRSVAIRTPARHVFRDPSSRTFDLADVFSDGHLVPPIGFALRELGIADLHETMTQDAVCEHLRCGDHAPLVKSMMRSVESIARMYAAVIEGDLLTVEWQIAPPADFEPLPET